MRKKYLSALLFGALLFASAGTFTSCKDNDDDINNLQEQINTINTTLSELKTLVGDGGVSSVTFDESTGVLTVVDANGTKTYTIKTTADAVEELKIAIEGQELKVNGETVGKVGDTVAVANGELTINGTATDIKVGEYSILDNQDAGTVTITLPDADGKMQTVVLAKASSSLTSLVLGDYTTFLSRFQEGTHVIQWGKAATDQNAWSVKRNQLLVGNISPIEVQVLPANFELDKVELSLVNSLGKKAPVKVTAVPNDKLLKPVTTRTSSKNGSWNIAIEMDETVTYDNIATAFENVNGDELAYALCVNGSPVTAYDIQIQVNPTALATTMDLKNTFKCLTYIDSDGYVVEMFSNGGGILPLDATTELTAKFNGGCEAFLYNSYITFEGTNKSLALARGISADGMTIKTTAASAGTNITATVHFLDVTGKEYTRTISFTVATSTAASLVADDVKYVVMPTKISNDVAAAIGDIQIINLNKVFEGIDAATRQKVKTLDQLSIVEEVGQTGFLAKSTNGIIASGVDLLKYLYKADGKIWNQNIYSSSPFDDDLLDLATIKLPFNKAKLGALQIASDAKPGKYVLYLVAKDIATDDTQANELFRIKLNVEIALPAFTDLYNKVDKNWSEGKFVARITPSGTTGNGFNADAILTMSSAYGPAVTNAETSRLSYLFSDNDCKYFQDLKYAYNGDKLNAVVNTDGIATLDKSKAYSGTTVLNVKELKDIVAYTSVFAGMVKFGTTNESNYIFEDGSKEAVEAIQEDFTVTSAPYNAQVKTALQGVQLVNYINKELRPANEPIQLAVNETINPLTFDGTTPKDGFGFELNGSYVSAKYTKDDVANQMGAYSLDGYALWESRTSWIDKDAKVSTKAEQTGVSTSLSNIGTATDPNFVYKVSNLTTGQSTTVTFKLTDQTGFNYSLTVTVVK